MTKREIASIAGIYTCAFCLYLNFMGVVMNKKIGAKNFHTSSQRHLTDGGRWKGGKRNFPLTERFL